MTEDNGTATADQDEAARERLSEPELRYAAAMGMGPAEYERLKPVRARPEPQKED